MDYSNSQMPHSAVDILFVAIQELSSSEQEELFGRLGIGVECKIKVKGKLPEFEQYGEGVCDESALCEGVKTWESASGRSYKSQL